MERGRDDRSVETRAPAAAGAPRVGELQTTPSGRHRPRAAGPRRQANGPQTPKGANGAVLRSRPPPGRARFGTAGPGRPRAGVLGRPRHPGIRCFAGRARHRRRCRASGVRQPAHLGPRPEARRGSPRARDGSPRRGNDSWPCHHRTTGHRHHRHQSGIGKGRRCGRDASALCPPTPKPSCSPTTRRRQLGSEPWASTPCPMTPQTTVCRPGWQRRQDSDPRRRGLTPRRRRRTAPRWRNAGGRWRSRNGAGRWWPAPRTARRGLP